MQLSAGVTKVVLWPRCQGLSVVRGVHCDIALTHEENVPRLKEISGCSSTAAVQLLGAQVSDKEALSRSYKYCHTGVILLDACVRLAVPPEQVHL